jgi:hypothetical protein
MHEIVYALMGVAAMDKTYFFMMDEKITTTQEDDKMVGTKIESNCITSERDENGKFLPMSEEVIRAALAQRSGIPRKHNSAQSDQSVLMTALEGSRLGGAISLEEMGL